MAERYRPETESQEMAFLVGEITSVVQVQVQGIDPEKNMRRDVHEYEVDEETIYRFDYTFEDGIKPKVKIEIKNVKKKKKKNIKKKKKKGENLCKFKKKPNYRQRS